MRSVTQSIKASQMKMPLATYEAHIAVDALIIVHTTEVITCSTILRQACDRHALARLVLQRFLIIVQKLLTLNCCLSDALDEGFAMGAHEVKSHSALWCFAAFRTLMNYTPSANFEGAMRKR